MVSPKNTPTPTVDRAHGTDGEFCPSTSTMASLQFQDVPSKPGMVAAIRSYQHHKNTVPRPVIIYLVCSSGILQVLPESEKTQAT